MNLDRAKLLIWRAMTFCEWWVEHIFWICIEGWHAERVRQHEEERRKRDG